MNAFAAEKSSADSATGVEVPDRLLPEHPCGSAELRAHFFEGRAGRPAAVDDRSGAEPCGCLEFVAFAFGDVEAVVNEHVDVSDLLERVVASRSHLAPAAAEPVRDEPAGAGARVDRHELSVPVSIQRCEKRHGAEPVMGAGLDDDIGLEGSNERVPAESTAAEVKPILRRWAPPQFGPQFLGDAQILVEFSDVLAAAADYRVDPVGELLLVRDVVGEVLELRVGEDVPEVVEGPAPVAADVAGLAGPTETSRAGTPHGFFADSHKSIVP